MRVVVAQLRAEREEQGEDLQGGVICIWGLLSGQRDHLDLGPPVDGEPGVRCTLRRREAANVWLQQTRSQPRSAHTAQKRLFARSTKGHTVAPASLACDDAGKPIEP